MGYYEVGIAQIQSKEKWLVGVVGGDGGGGDDDVSVVGTKECNCVDY